MAEIVVFDIRDTTKSESEMRYDGMVHLGALFNKYHMAKKSNPGELALSDIFADNNYKIEYQGEPVEEYNKGKFSTANYEFVFKQNVDDVAGKGSKKMNISEPAGNDDLINPSTGSSYLDKVLDDLNVVMSDENRKYLLGTITFRRCR